MLNIKNKLEKFECKTGINVTYEWLVENTNIKGYQTWQNLIENKWKFVSKKSLIELSKLFKCEIKDLFL